MHEALCRPSGTTLDIVHAERRAADHSTNIGSSASCRKPGTKKPDAPAAAYAFARSSASPIDFAGSPSWPRNKSVRALMKRSTPFFYCRVTNSCDPARLPVDRIKPRALDDAVFEIDPDHAEFEKARNVFG